MARVTSFGSRCAGNQHAADNKIGFTRRLRNVVAVRGQRVEAAAEDVFELAQTVQVHVDERDLGAEAERDPGCIGAHYSSAEDGDMRRRHAGHAAQQNAAAAAFFFEIARAHLHTHAACNFAHGRQQRQRSLAVANRFIGDADDL